MAINSAPPKKPVTPPKKPPPENPDKIQSEREDAVNGIWSALSAICVAGNQWADAGAISTHGPNISREAARLANKYEKLANGIDALANVSPFANLLAPVMMLGLQIAANHKMVPANAIPGIKDPQILESEMRVEAMRQATAWQKMVAAEKAALDAELAEMAKLNVPEE